LGEATAFKAGGAAMWALYVRVSKVDLNPENQRIELERFARERGWQYSLFVEVESTKNTRPIKEKLMNRLTRCEFEGVIIWKIDRWARSTKELMTDIADLLAANRQLIITTTPIDTTSASGRLVVAVLGAMAEFERELIRERTLAGLARARAQGKHIGRPRKHSPMKQGEGLPSEAP
jgi:DNA invertase Pin-like site-specific DNA recombinase